MDKHQTDKLREAFQDGQEDIQITVDDVCVFGNGAKVGITNIRKRTLVATKKSIELADVAWETSRCSDDPDFMLLYDESGSGEAWLKRRGRIWLCLRRRSQRPLRWLLILLGCCLVVEIGYLLGEWLFGSPW